MSSCLSRSLACTRLLTCLTTHSISEDDKAAAAAAKDEGNDNFKAGKHAEAVEFYTVAVGESSGLRSCMSSARLSHTFSASQMPIR